MAILIKKNSWDSIPLEMYHTLILFSARDVATDPATLDLVQCELERNGIHLAQALPTDKSIDAVAENSLGYCKYRWLANGESDHYYHLFFVTVNLNSVNTIIDFSAILAHELTHVLQDLIRQRQLDGNESVAYVAEYLLRSVMRSCVDLRETSLSAEVK
jgi:hypothetical protein